MQNSVIDVVFTEMNLMRLLGGLAVTSKIALISIVLGSILGIGLGLIMTLKSKVIRLICRLYLEVFRIIPILVWLFIVYFGIPTVLDIHLEGELVAIIVFTLWGAAEMGDIVRGSLESLPNHQIESGKALGLSFGKLYRYVLIPQAVRRMLPGAINLATRMVKTTSLVVLIGVVEVLKVGQQIIEVSSRNGAPTAPLWVYGLVFVLYFIICYPLSILSRKLEAKWNS